MPVVVADGEQRALGSVAGAIDHGVYAAPFIQGGFKQPGQVVGRPVRAGDADAAQFARQGLALAGR
ncbi:hypothetical protein D3C87_1913630 [compost metagenome]